MSAETRSESILNSLGEALPAETRRLVDEAVTWIRNHPGEAAAIGAAGGFLLGLTGFGRAYRGARTLRAMPIVSDLVLALIAGKLMGKESGATAESIH